MSVLEERIVEFRPEGLVELRMDRVKTDGSNRETNRLKVARRLVRASEAMPDGGFFPVLPEGCRFVRHNSTYDVYVVEQPPQVRTIAWTYNVLSDWESVAARGALRKFGLTEKDKTRRLFHLAFPYTVFAFVVGNEGVTDIRAYFRVDPLQTETDFLLKASLTNCYGDNWGKPQSICMGNDAPTAGRRNEGAKLVEGMIGHFWQSVFNDHIPTQYDSYRSRIPQLATIFDWEYSSRIDPNWPMRATGWQFANTLDRVLANWSGEAQSEGTLFNDLVRRIQAAKEWREDTDGDGSDLVPSPSLSVLVGDEVWQTGDELVATQDQSESGIKMGQTVKVKYFYEPDGSEKRFARLEGLAKPVLLYRARQVFFRNKVGEKAFIKIGDTPVSPGTRFLVTSDDGLIKLSKDIKYRIVELVLDGENDVKVKVEGTNSWVYITHKGGQLLPSVRLLVPRLEGGAFSCGDLVLTPGEIVRITSSAGSLTKNMVLRVQSTREDNGRFLTTFDGLKSEVAIYEQGNVIVEWRPFKYQLTDTEIIFDDKVFGFENNTHILAAGLKSPLQAGFLYQFRRLAPSQRANHHPLDVDLEFERGNDTIPIVKNSEWQAVVVADLTPVSLVWQEQGCQLSAGQILKYIGDETNGVKTGDKLEIFCFVRNKKDSKIIDLIFSNGLSFSIGKDTLGFFKLVEGSVDRTIETGGLPEVGGCSSNRRFSTGSRVKYCGGGSHTGQVCKVTRTCSNGCHLTVEFEDGYCRSDTAIDCFESVSTMLFTRIFFPVPIAAEGSSVFRRQDGSLVTLPPLLAAELPGIRKPIALKIADRNKKPISVGDVAVPLGLNWNYRNLAQNAIGQPGIAIHSYYGSGTDYVFLLFGSDYRMDNHGVGNFDSLPPRFKESRFLGHIGIVAPGNFEVLEPIPPPPVVEKKEHKKPAAGVSVKIKSGVVPVSGWGGVKPEEIGLIIDLDGDNVMVDFPSNSEWLGLLTELAVSQYDRKKAVKLWNGFPPRFLVGQVQKNEIGYVVGQCDDGILIVDFPSQPGWFADPSEIVVVENPG